MPGNDVKVIIGELNGELLELCEYDLQPDDIGVSRTKAGTVPGGSFTTISGKKIFDVLFTAPFIDDSYSISLVASDQRIWHYESKSNTGFRINSQSNAPLSGEISWQAIANGEST